MKINYNRIIVLDTETTGINKIGIHYKNHKIIEIGAVEIINRKLTGRYFHTYLRPNRLIDLEAFNIHGINDNFLLDKPIFSDIVDVFLNFIKNSELVIHNANFDIGFINNELNILNYNISKIENLCKITDSLSIARKIFPGKRNNLDSLCKRYKINKKKRIYHGALLDAEILADIFLLMTGGQMSIDFGILDKEKKYKESMSNKQFLKLKNNKLLLKIIYANKNEILSHKKYLNLIKKNRNCLQSK